MQEQRSACPDPSRSSRQRSPRRDRKPAKGFRPFKFGRDHGFILNDGVWEKPHDPAFIANVSVEETKAALAAAGIPNEVVPIPFNVTSWTKDLGIFVFQSLIESASSNSEKSARWREPAP